MYCNSINIPSILALRHGLDIPGWSNPESHHHCLHVWVLKVSYHPPCLQWQSPSDCLSASAATVWLQCATSISQHMLHHTCVYVCLEAAGGERKYQVWVWLTGGFSSVSVSRAHQVLKARLRSASVWTDVKNPVIHKRERERESTMYTKTIQPKHI